MAMGLIKDQVLKALSSGLNTDVTCDELDVSPLRGAVQVTNLQIAGDGDEPLVTIARATGKLSMAKALGGAIAISELNVEGLRIRIARDASGEWNFPKKRISFAKPESTTTKPATAPAKKRTVDIEKALIIDAAIHFIHAMKAAPPYEVLATPIMANLARGAGGYDVTLIVQDVKRPDTGDSLGSCNIAIKLDGLTDLMRVMESALSLTAQLDTRASATITTPSIGGGPYSFDAKADVDLATLKAAVPAALLVRVPNVTGNIAMDAAGSFDRKAGVKLQGASMRIGPSEVIFK